MEDIENNHEEHEMREMRDHNDDDVFQDAQADVDNENRLENEEQEYYNRLEEMHQSDGQVAETSFIEPLDKETLDRIVGGIENENLRENVELTINADSDEKGEISGESLKNALLDGISNLEIDDRLVKDRWDDKEYKDLNLEEHEKFEYRQKLAHINEALESSEIFIREKNERAYHFLKDFQETYVESERGISERDVNGYRYKGQKVIKRGYAQDDQGRRIFKFRFEKNVAAEQLKNQFKDIANSSFKDQVISIMGKNEPEYETKQTVENYLNELRNIEKEKIKNAEKIGELKERIREINAINEEAEEIKQNNPVKIDKESFAKALKGKVAKFLKENRGSVIIGGVTTSFGLLGSILTALGIKGHLKNAAKKIGQLGELVEKTGKTMKVMSKTINNLTKFPLQTAAVILRSLGYFTKEVSQKPLVLLSIIVILFVVYIIKWTVRSIRRK